MFVTLQHAIATPITTPNSSGGIGGGSRSGGVGSLGGGGSGSGGSGGGGGGGSRSVGVGVGSLGGGGSGSGVGNVPIIPPLRLRPPCGGSNRSGGGVGGSWNGGGGGRGGVGGGCSGSGGVGGGSGGNVLDTRRRCRIIIMIAFIGIFICSKVAVIFSITHLVPWYACMYRVDFAQKLISGTCRTPNFVLAK